MVKKKYKQVAVIIENTCETLFFFLSFFFLFCFLKRSNFLHWLVLCFLR